MPRLYVDIGKNTGWCLAPMPAPNGAVHGWADMKQGRFESAGVRWLNFIALLNRMDADHGVDEVIYEEVRNHRGVDAAHAYGGYIAHLQSWCLQRDIRYRTITVQAAKKAATGKGNADKAAVVAAVKAKGYAVKDENEADAVAIMLADDAQRAQAMGMGG
jgi:Holliday junction resolvasome RuvABC endonuclease subunit